MLAVAFVLGAVTALEGVLTGRFSVDGAKSPVVAETSPVETRLAAEPPPAANSLTMLSLPASPAPWRQDGSDSESEAAAKTAADFWSRQYELLSVKQRDYLQATLRFAIRGETSPLGTSDRAELLRNLETQAEQYGVKAVKEIASSTILSEKRQAEFQSGLENVLMHWREVDAPAISKALQAEPLDAKDKETLVAIESNWRRLSMLEVHDDEPTPAKDFVAWFGLLDQLQHDSNCLKDAQDASYADLFDQASQLRGKAVLVKGVIRAAEYVKAKPNLYGVEGYYVCWIRPDNYQDAPVKVFSLTAPGGGAIDQGADFSALIDRKCELSGLYFKRMVYRAQDDLRTVPTVLCATIALTATETPPPHASQSIGLIVLLALAGVIGAVVLFIFLFSDRGPVKQLPEKLDLPSKIASEN